MFKRFLFFSFSFFSVFPFSHLSFLSIVSPESVFFFCMRLSLWKKSRQKILLRPFRPTSISPRLLSSFLKNTSYRMISSLFLPLQPRLALLWREEALSRRKIRDQSRERSTIQRAIHLFHLIFMRLRSLLRLSCLTPLLKIRVSRLPLLLLLPFHVEMVKGRRGAA
ncbi:hypothetical protein CSUI_005107 [Cystoisospora suis]|uniref:Uncharacterized protein n=1 Tax=Cystoisospora suis TaxID=483139 RepID=A0A2C6KZ53_9APIC|nr:hypothetical protein CSUI_005107 [Cystoisospora suis]